MHTDNQLSDEGKLELWGGLECTVNRVQDRYHCQLTRNGHRERPDDIARFASLGISAIRYPVLWEHVAPDGLAGADWRHADAALKALREQNITPILGLVHHGSGPAHTSLVDPEFAPQLTAYASAVASRFPWAEWYTVVNEPLTTARFACLYGHWYPHARSDELFLRAVLNQCKGTILAMRAIRAVNPQAKLVQTDDLGKTYGTPAMQAVTEFYNERRWLAWDLLCGKVDAEHPLRPYMLKHGVDPAELAWFEENACPPDIIGVNYYVTSERWLDHRVDNYPPQYRGFAETTPCADIETSRVLAVPSAGIGPLLDEAWLRYGIPLAVTEAHINASREDQMRWLLEIWEASKTARRKGVDIRAVTVWSLLGSFDWNSLVTVDHGHYECGPFDLRSPQPRPTALAAMMRQLASGEGTPHPAIHGKGWWRRSERFLCPPVATSDALASISADAHQVLSDVPAVILITGARGTLGQAFARICKQRNLAYRLLSRDEMDIAVEASVIAAVEQHQPWAIINASGYVRVDDAEEDAERCLRENATGPAVLAAVCASRGIHLTTFSSDLVFDGSKTEPHVESDPVNPLNVYGVSKAEAERQVLQINPEALVVRTSAFFGPWDQYNFVTQALDALGRGDAFTAAADVIISPTYVPDLVHCCLDLIIDRERGIWHLTNGDALTWSELAKRAAQLAQVDASTLVEQSSEQLGLRAARPLYTAMSSIRGRLLPTLDSALTRFLSERQVTAESVDMRYATDQR